MKATLLTFTNEHLFEASASMLKHLHIKFAPQSKSPLSFSDLYTDATSSSIPAGLASVVEKLANTYLIGAIDEDTLAGRDTNLGLDKLVDGKYQTMLVFAVEIRQGEVLSRTDISTLTRGFNRMAPELPVILFIKNGDFLTLATCERSQYKQDWRGGEKLGKVSILRDVNCITPHRGHIDILESIGDKAYPTFDELYAHWLDVFSSELLTKKFYTELSEWFAWVISSGEVSFPNDITTTDDDTKYNHEAVIRLITRLIFVWFLRQKKLIPKGLFEEKFIRDNFIENFDPHSTNTLFYNPHESKYYRLILQNLFFAMLNRPIVDEISGSDENRRFVTAKRFKGISPDYNVNNLMRYYSEFKDGGADKLLQIANAQIPFLSGGLFDCLDDKDNNKYLDGFSERKASLEQLSFPDYFFFGKLGDFTADLSAWYDDNKKSRVRVRGLINILRSYNFTVEENTPLDQEVSLDPELLGKVFENLLASYNPETNKSARKQTGSFYTPREIVKYMVDESLISYLHRKCQNIDKSVFRDLFNYSIENFDLSESNRHQIMKALYECKALDPACGSGAFPMGMLQQMVQALRKLDPTNEMWRNFILEIALEQDKDVYLNIEDEQERSRLRKDIEQAFNQNVNDPDYARKLYLIENCIYGVDIQPIAVQISKLRFFISLVAEQKPTDDPTSNFGIRPLPNLEARFVAANTLIQLKKEQNLFVSTDELEKIKKQLSSLNHKLFIAKSNRAKKDIRSKITELRKKYGEELISMGSIGPTSASMLAGWDMFDQNSSAPFFDSEWMFDISNGMDIVIGNPPYVQLQSNEGVLAKIYENCEFETFARTGDIYCLFYERGWQLLKESGHLCYITSNKWMRAGYGEKTRGFFAQKTNPELLIDFGGIQVFESATVDTNILLFSKSKNMHKTICAVTNKQDKERVKNLSDFVQHEQTICDFSSEESWVILSPIEQSIKRKIESVGTPLKDWDIQIYRGVLTGYNEAFIISTDKRNEILANCSTEDERKRTAELIRPILRGRDIKRYGYDWANLWLINTHNGIKGVKPRIDINDYPAVKAHLDQYYPKLSKRADKGDTPYNLRNCAYLEDFFKPKLFYADITQQLNFSRCDEVMFCNNTTYFITSSHEDILTHLDRYLNSKLIDWYYRTISVQLGESAVRMFSIYVLRIPIPYISEQDIYTQYGLNEMETEYIESL